MPKRAGRPALFYKRNFAPFSVGPETLCVLENKLQDS